MTPRGTTTQAALYLRVSTEDQAEHGVSLDVQQERLVGRSGEPVEVAGPVVFLASEAASLITGEILVVDEGWTTR